MPSSTAQVVGNDIVLAAGGKVDGRVVSTDGAKLDGIAAGAQVCSAANVQTACAALASALAVNSQKITGLANGSASSDAAAFGQIAATALSAFAVPTGDVSLNSHKITSLAAGTAAGNSVRWEQAKLNDNSNLTSWAGPRIAPPEEFDDFQFGGLATTGSATIAGAAATSVLNSNLSWRVNTVGTGSSITTTTTGLSATSFGLMLLDPGTTTTGAAGMGRNATAVPNMVLGSGQVFAQEWKINWAADSTGTDTFTIFAGWMNSFNVAPSDGVYFSINKNSDANIRAKATKTGAGTSTDSAAASVAATAATDTRLRLQWDGTTVTAIVNGTTIGTITGANIPTANLVPAIFILKTAGTASGKTVTVDYYWEARAWASGRVS